MAGPHGRMTIPLNGRGAIPTDQRTPVSYVPGQNETPLSADGAQIAAAGMAAANRANAENLAGLNRLAGAADHLVQAGIKAYETYESAKAQEAYNEYERETRLARARLNELKGKNALGENGVVSQFEKWRDETATRLEENLDPIARDLFRKNARKLDGDTFIWATEKVNRENAAWQNSISQGTIANALDNVGDDPGDMAAYGRAMGIVKAEYERMAARSGWSDEETRAKISEMEQKLEESRVGLLIESGRLDEARSALGGGGGFSGKIGGKAITRGMKPEVESLIREAANKYGVDPELALALAMQESSGDQRSISHAGAIGVMQLMPGTAKELGVNPRDLKQNIDGGVRYLAKQLKDFGGNVQDALTAYNMGPGGYRLYKQGKRGITQESREYAGRVLGRMKGGSGQGESEGTGGGFRRETLPENYSGILDGGQRGKLWRRLQAEERRIEAENQRQLATRSVEMADEIQDGIALCQDGDTNATFPAESEIRAVFGKRAEHILTQIRVAEDFAVGYQELKEATPAQAQEILKSFKPSGQEDYAIRQRYYEQMARVIDADAKKRMEDPVAYAADASRDVNAARISFFEKPSAENWATYKKQLEIFRATRDMPGEELLSKRDAKSWGDNLRKDPNLLQTADKLRQDIGADYPQVMKEIAPNLGDRINIALACEDRGIASRLMEITRDKDFIKNAKTLIPDWGDYGDQEINRKIADELTDFTSSLLAGVNVDDRGMAVSAQEAVKSLAASYAMQEKIPITDAIRRAANDLFNNRYDYYTINGHSVRVPKELRDSIDKGKFNALYSLMIERSGDYMREKFGQLHLDEETLVRDIMYGQAYLITDDSESGVILFRGINPVADKDGNIVRFSWEDIGKLKPVNPNDLNYISVG